MKNKINKFLLFIGIFGFTSCSGSEEDDFYCEMENEESEESPPSHIPKDNFDCTCDGTRFLWDYDDPVIARSNHIPRLDEERNISVCYYVCICDEDKWSCSWHNRFRTYGPEYDPCFFY